VHSITVQCKPNRAIRLVLGQTADLGRCEHARERFARHAISSAAWSRRLTDSDGPSDAVMMRVKASR
jgi:hypothetical protein